MTKIWFVLSLKQPGDWFSDRTLALTELYGHLFVINNEKAKIKVLS